ncbi:MAG: hypothetical protein AABX34_02535 [Nanoarchaeota archaeon]
MRIKKIIIESYIEEKINKKHGVYRNEIEDALFEGSSIFYRTKDNRYVAIASKERYITIIFLYQRGVAAIITAYASSDWQIKLFKRKRLKK